MNNWSDDENVRAQTMRIKETKMEGSKLTKTSTLLKVEMETKQKSTEKKKEREKFYWKSAEDDFIKERSRWTEFDDEDETITCAKRKKKKNIGWNTKRTKSESKSRIKRIHWIKAVQANCQRNNTLPEIVWLHFFLLFFSVLTCRTQ